MEARTGESGLRRGQEKESAGANCTARWAVHRGAPLKAQVPSPQPKKTHRIERWVFFCSLSILTGLEGGGANGRERFAKGAGKRKRGSKLHSPVGCAPGRAAKGASPVTSTKKNTPLYARAFMEIILLYVSLFIRRIVIRSSQ